MKASEVQPGMVVAVNSRPTGLVYDVKSVNGNTAYVTYPGKFGPLETTIEVSLLTRPTQAQLAHNGRS